MKYKPYEPTGAVESKPSNLEETARLSRDSLNDEFQDIVYSLEEPGRELAQKVEAQRKISFKPF
jgi:hypothetical protein